ncbi:MAG TPA: DOMON-like domain-containing protein [Anaerolineales bacterium]
MTERSFSLIPFTAPNIPSISITGKISLQNNIITLHYLLAGKIEEILLPTKSMNPTRKDELWKMTCFEFFLAIKDQPQYWEFNMSPSGDWNVYHMDAYRRIGFREETSIQRLPFDGQSEMGVLHLNARVDLHPILQPNQSLKFGITAIIQTTEGNETYWALSHPASIADFHLRESFTLGLARQTHLVQQSALDG